MHWPCVLEPAGGLDQSLKVREGNLLFACHQYISPGWDRQRSNRPPKWQQLFLSWPLWFNFTLQINKVHIPRYSVPHIKKKISNLESLLCPLSRPGLHYWHPDQAVCTILRSPSIFAFPLPRGAIIIGTGSQLANRIHKRELWWVAKKSEHCRKATRCLRSTYLVVRHT